MSSPHDHSPQPPSHLLCFECPRHLLWFDCASHSPQPINPIHTLPPTCPSYSIPATSAPPRSTLIHTPFNSLKDFVNPLHWMFSQRIGHFFTRKFGHGTNGRFLIQHMDMDGNATFFSRQCYVVAFTSLVCLGTTI